MSTTNGESPDVVYGRLLEGAHLGAYTFERVFSELTWLLEEDRWQTVGPGYTEISDFLTDLDLSDFRIVATQRKALGAKLAELGASNRATAKSLGVGTRTVDRDRAPDDAPDDATMRASETAGASGGAPGLFAQGASAGKAVAKNAARQAGRRQRDGEIAARRKEQEREAAAMIDADGADACRIEVGDVHGWNPSGVDCIVTDPPYITEDAVELHSALATFACEVLPPGGALAVMTSQALLPQVFAAMERPGELVYRWTAAWIFETSARSPERGPRVFDGWKPVLVFHRSPGWDDETTYLYDTVNSPDADKDAHAWGQNIDGFRQLVRAVSRPGETVCDPFTGGGTTAIAALAEQRRFTGIDLDPDAVATARKRLGL